MSCFLCIWLETSLTPPFFFSVSLVLFSHLILSWPANCQFRKTNHSDIHSQCKGTFHIHPASTSVPSSISFLSLIFISVNLPICLAVYISTYLSMHLPILLSGYRVLLCIPVLPQTYSPPVSTSSMLGLQVCATHSSKTLLIVGGPDGIFKWQLRAWGQ